jgi:rhamnulose-1-phosphate aldolase/alcohol dehydrogenase
MPMISRWDEAQAPTGPVEQLVYSSRLIGREPSLVLWGGGNTSLKGTATDHRGRRLSVMFIKATGADLKDADRRHYPPVRMDDIAAAREREDMDVREMVDYITRALVEPGAPRPSIETLLHGFLPFPAVHHTHADAILAIADNLRAAELVAEVYGDDAFLVPYVIPGFRLSLLTAQMAERHPKAVGCVLEHHGLLSWGDGCRQSYERHVELVGRAEAYLAPRRRRAMVTPTVGASDRESVAARVAPVLRGLLFRQTRRGIVRYDGSDRAAGFTESPDAERLSQVGAATPDHMLNTKRVPLFVGWDPTAGPAGLEAVLRAGVEGYEHAYVEYVRRFNPSLQPLREPPPRVVLVRGLGLFGAGADLRAATAAFDIARHTLGVLEDAESVGEYRSLDLPDAYEAEYYPPELDKLLLAPGPHEFSGRVALVTGAARGIGRAIAARLAADGALVAVTDLDGDAACRTAAEIGGSAAGWRMDVTNEDEVDQAFAHLCRRWGGVDVVVSNAGAIFSGAIAGLELEDWRRSLEVNATGHFLVCRAAVRVMSRQGMGGAIVVNCTRNVLVPGRELGAYSAAKAAAAQLAKILAVEHGPDGIRVNVVHPDAIFTDLWTPEVRASRARAYGIAEEDLEEHYRQRTLLRRSVTAEDVAEAVAFLAGERSAKSTGNMLVVDAGAREAFPR